MSQGFDPYGAWLGIPPDQRPPHAYALLGLAPGEGNAYAISAAADRAAGRLRMLLSGPQAATAAQLLNEIEGARHMLLDPAQKARYDAQLRQPSGDSAYRPAPRPGMAGPLPTGPMPTAPMPSAPMPSAPNYGYGSQPAAPAPGWGQTPSPAPGWSLPQPAPAAYPQQPFSPYQQPGYPAPAATYPNYSQPAAAPYYPAAYPTPAYQPAPAYASSYPAAAPPPVAEAPAPAKPPEETPEFSTPSVASRPSSADAMFWPWMLIGAGAVLAMGLALVWLMQQNPPPAPPVVRNPPPVTRNNPITPLPPLRQAKPRERFLESPQKKIGEGDGPIPIPGVTERVGDPAPTPTAVASLPASTASIAGLAEAANAKIAPLPMTPGMSPTVAASGNMNPMPMPMAMPPAGTDPMKPMVAGTDPMKPMVAGMDPTMKPMPAPLPADPMKPVAVALADIPPAVELPSYDENAPAGSAGATPVRLGPVHLADKQKLELALLDGETATGQPGSRFALSQAGTTDAKPTWQAEFIDEANKPTPLGRFTYEDQALRFAWLGGADAQKTQRFRNVRLAMMVASERHTSALRKPIETPQFTLNLEGLSAKHVVSGLPDADDLGLEIIDQTATGPEHKIEPAAKVPAGKETDIVFATTGEKPTKLRFRFLLARPSPNSLRIDGRVLVDTGKPQAFRLDTLKQNLELSRKQKIALEGEFLDFQQKGGRQNRQAYQAAETLHRQRSDALTTQITSLEEFIKLCEEVNQKASFQYRVFMKLSDAEVDLVRGTTAMAAK